ncbi:MAG: helix-turn-helix transcriptional regulator [Hyphomicrobiaceae bacterium]
MATDTASTDRLICIIMGWNCSIQHCLLAPYRETGRSMQAIAFHDDRSIAENAGADPMNELSAERASYLIGLIYDCVTDPERWQVAVDALRGELGTATTVLQAISLTDSRLLANFTSGIPDCWLTLMEQYAQAATDAWGGTERVARFANDEPLRQSEVVGNERLQKSQFAREWGNPQGLVDSIALFSFLDRRLFAGLACGIHESRPFHESMRTNLRLLAPHIRRTIEISGLLDMKRIEAETLEAALDGLLPAIVLVGDDMSVVHANASARELLRDRDPISEASGRLALPHVQTTAALADAVKRCASGLVTLGQRGIGIPVRRRDGSPALVHVLPLQPSKRTSGVSWRAVAAVFVASAAAPPQMPAAALALLYDLTPAETRVLELIVEGRQPAEAAAHLGITLATVKTHLVRVFDKTGVNRQADLVRLVGSLTLPV